MLCLILIVGGLLIMMGQHNRSEALFYYFRLEDQVPETHLLRLIERHISFAFVRERLKQSYSETGRPSIDPELLLRILLIGYLYGITSERKLVEELRQLPGGQPQLRDRRCASNGSTDESGNGSRAGHAHSFHAMARTNTRIGSSRHDLRERGVLALVGGSEHHSLYANPRQYPPKEQSVLRSRAVHVSQCSRAAQPFWAISS
jgi:Transposase domain (DUF772)